MLYVNRNMNRITCRQLNTAELKYFFILYSQYITELDVSLTKAEQTTLRAQGFNKIKVDLNKGTKGYKTYLWYKKGSGSWITRIQTSFNTDMEKGLVSVGYHKISKNLNYGAGGDYVYLWSYIGSSEYDVPIVDLHISTEPDDEAQYLRSGWERIGCDLNRRTDEKHIYLWVKREQPTYICDITATSGFLGDENMFQEGYIRVDEDTNRDAGGSRVFIWYRRTTSTQGAIRDLQVSVNDEERESFQNQGYTSVIQQLNEGTEGNQVLLWFKKDAQCGKPIKSVNLLINQAAVKPYEEVGAKVIEKNLNEGNGGHSENLVFYQ